MKKLSLFVGAIVLSTAAMAQRPTDSNPFSLEGTLSLSALDQTFTAPAVRFRYFATENISVRVGLGFDNSSSTRNAYGLGADFNPSADSIGTGTFKTSSTQISIGGAYHFSQLDKLSPYAYLDLNIGMGGTSSETENFIAGDPNGFPPTPDAYSKGMSSTSESKFSTMGVNIGAGFDYYFAENVFFGAEMGFMFGSWKDKGGDSSSTTGGVTTNSTLHESGNNSSFATGSFGLRLGWRF